jgi:hypothetical protein
MSNVTTGRRDVEVSAKHVSYQPYINAHMIGKDIACNIPPCPVVNLPSSPWRQTQEVSTLGHYRANRAGMSRKRKANDQ